MEFKISNFPITKNGLDKIDSSPLDYWYNYLRPDREDYVKSNKTIFDEAFRLSVFNFEKFKNTYIRSPKIDKRSQIGKSEYLALLNIAEKQFKILLEELDYDTILSMRNAVLNHATSSKLCLEDKLNTKIDYHEKESGAVIKFKPNFINPMGIIVNLSSTDDASNYNFSKECWNFRHDKRAAIYIDGTGINDMVFITVESKAPYKIGIRYLDEKSINFGRETYLKNCQTYAECLKSGVWIGIEPSIVEGSLPNWVFNKF